MPWVRVKKKEKRKIKGWVSISVVFSSLFVPHSSNTYSSPLLFYSSDSLGCIIISLTFSLAAAVVDVKHQQKILSDFC